MIQETVWNCEKALFSGCKYAKYGEPASSAPGVCKRNEVNELFQEKSDTLSWLSFLRSNKITILDSCLNFGILREAEGSGDSKSRKSRKSK